MPGPDRFVRVPNALLDALLRMPMTGAQWYIVFWVIRQTLGWNRNKVSFTWYRLAKELTLDRGGVVRAGNRLVRSGILYLEDGEIGIRENPAGWKTIPHGPENTTMTADSDDGDHRKAMTAVTMSDDASQRKRCRESSLFRRAKDSSKDRLKTYKNKRRSDDARQRFRNGAFSEHHPAGAGRPIPGKYDSISKD